MYRAMEHADMTYDPEIRSASGLAGGDGKKLETFRKREKGLVGDFLAEVMEKAVKMGESNACMRRIVAAPTAGSCGVIPSVLLTYREQKAAEEEAMVKALFVAAGIGEALAASASISGAEGGCQAEIGSASAMAAGAVTYLEGGGAEEIVNAAALALKNMLGLTCDPVAGLVEVPCIKRNVAGAVNAVTSSQMSLAGIRSAIPPDEVIDSMRRIGKQLPPCLKETGQEGLAATPTARAVAKRLQ
jgi:L-serine dehydratase